MGVEIVGDLRIGLQFGEGARWRKTVSFRGDTLGIKLQGFGRVTQGLIDIVVGRCAAGKSGDRTPTAGSGQVSS
jgi:hypothetical protein